MKTMTNALLHIARRKALRAARKGDMRAADAIELDYIKGDVRLFSRRADGIVPAECSRMCRGAGASGETLLEWNLPNGKVVYSDMNANVLRQYEDDACAMLLNFDPGRLFECA
jgi:hypothetical protein